MLLLVGTAGFEPATPCSQSRCADQAAPRPVVMASELRRCYIPSLVEGKRSADCAAASTSASAFWSRRRGNDSAQRRRPRLLVRAYLRAGNKSPRTVETCLEAVNGFDAHLVATSRRLLEQAHREDVEAWMTALLARWCGSSA